MADGARVDRVCRGEGDARGGRDAGRCGRIDDLDLLRHGGMGTVFTDVRAPSTLGSFLRNFTFGPVRQRDAVASRALIGLAEVVPGLIAGGDGLVMLDIDGTVKPAFA